MKPAYSCWTCPGCVFLYTTEDNPRGTPADLYYCSRNPEHAGGVHDHAPGGRIRMILRYGNGTDRLDPFYGVSLASLANMTGEENHWRYVYVRALERAMALGLTCKRECDKVFFK